MNMEAFMGIWSTLGTLIYIVIIFAFISTDLDVQKISIPKALIVSAVLGPLAIEVTLIMILLLSLEHATENKNDFLNKSCRLLMKKDVDSNDNT